MKKIFLYICLLFLSIGSVSADQILVENIFLDIDAEYEYRDELQALYDRGMIIPNQLGLFAPDEYLNRDEFVGISMEVICERCIQPHTEPSLIGSYFNEEIYFDVNNSNPYFYCIAIADEQNYVRGYDIGQSCQNGTNQAGERPFCPINQINLEEAVAVLLRNSGIFTIDDNKEVISEIYAGNVFQTLGNDVKPKDDLGNPYTFYGYLRRALNYQITEYDTSGNAKVLSLIEPDVYGNINPQRAITKEEFLKMSYIALQSNSCSAVSNNGLALSMNILEKSCNSGDSQNCAFSDLEDADDTYDFESNEEGACDAGVADPTGYIWRFHNLDSGQQYIKYGKYIDNYNLDAPGKWRIYLRVIDECGNSSESYSTIFVGESENADDDEYIDADIDVYDDNCSAPGTSCEEIEFENEEDDGDNTFDFHGDASTSCNIGSVVYKWTFTHSESGTKYNYDGEYVDDVLLGLSGEWSILLKVTDGCDKTGTETLTYIVVDDNNDDEYIDADIDVYDDNCSAPGTSCEEIEFENEEDDGDNTFDFHGDASTSCNVGSVVYKWTFTHSESGTKYNYDGEYVDDVLLGLSGEWSILLKVTDGCDKTGTETLTYIVVDDNNDDEYIDADIDVYDDNCSAPGTSCEEIEFENEEDDGDNTFDFHGDASTSCNIGSVVYKWTFTHSESGTKYNYDGEYVDDVLLGLSGEWSILLKVTDGCDKTGTETLTYIVVDDNNDDEYIDADIDVYDDNCSAPGTSCEEIEFENEEDDGDNTFDFDADIFTSCDIDGINYSWVFRNAESGARYDFDSEYIDDFTFLESGVWNIVLTVVDACGQTAQQSMTYIMQDADASALNVTIVADPISGPEGLEVDFNALIAGGTGPYTYEWDFGDTQEDFSQNIQHLYLYDGVYDVVLTVTDANGVTGTATLVILVTEKELCLGDSDGDGVIDCDDLCPLVAGNTLNDGCPILETSCSDTCGCDDGYVCGDSDPLTCSTGVCIPVFEPATSCLYKPEFGSIYGSAVCSTCPCNSYLDFLADVRRCDLVFPAITSPDGSQIYSQGDLWQVQ